MDNSTKCLRLYADVNGESHIVEIAFPMEAIQFAPPAPPLFLTEPMPASQVSWLQFPSDWIDEAHPSPRRQLFALLSGAVEIWTSLGDRKTLAAGDCLLMEDTTGKGHGARPIGGTARGIMIALA